MLRQDSIPNALCDSGGKFWKEIKKMSPNNIPLPVSIDDITGKQAVTNMWKDHFKNLLNCVNGKDSRNLISEWEFDPSLVISPGEIEDAINKLMGGNQADWTLFMLSILNMATRITGHCLLNV